MVLLAHLAPLGPKAWRLNETAGPLGMALFFTLSGFLITHFLLRNDSVAEFLAHRIFRIVPLAWLYMAIVFTIRPVDSTTVWASLLFFANVPPMWLIDETAHLWSLCVEMHFYAGVALLVALGGRRALIALPFLCLGVTVGRVATGSEISIVTWLRIDEILAGAILALTYHGRLGNTFRGAWARLNPVVPFALLLVACHPDSGAFNYFRPYLAAALVGATLLGAPRRSWKFLEGRALAYLAAISFALYVIHPLLAHSWLGSGDTLTKYAKRPLLLATLFALTHLSTFHFEKRCIASGRRLGVRLRTSLATH
jgi:peptidoglycan/LPS O-acetylase OafA/YrhL